MLCPTVLFINRGRYIHPPIPLPLSVSIPLFSRKNHIHIQNHASPIIPIIASSQIVPQTKHNPQLPFCVCVTFGFAFAANSARISIFILLIVPIPP